ncbi:MAG TPA: hypothetical protein VNA65_11095 [Candidatus Dormibacteraeota bacterium]|nr:hypothetical protein [Candidatus Dormibacteraeota bacterium]
MPIGYGASVHSPAIGLLLLGAASVAVVHSILPDHWVPLAVVARTQQWKMSRLATTSFLAAGGHVLTSIVLGGVIAVIGLQFQRQIETQQGHIVGGVLVLTGIGFLVWGLTGHGHAHAHGSDQDESQHELPGDFHSTNRNRGLRQPSMQEVDDHAHQHVHQPGMTLTAQGDHMHEHEHGGTRHSHRHHHEVFIQKRAELIAERGARPTAVGRLSAIAVPFGVAASPDLSFLPLALAASAYGVGSVGLLLGVFALVTMITFVGLTLIATAAGYQMRGEWLEKNANAITAAVLIAIGVIAYVGL